MKAIGCREGGEIDLVKAIGIIGNYDVSNWSFDSSFGEKVVFTFNLNLHRTWASRILDRIECVIYGFCHSHPPML